MQTLFLEKRIILTTRTSQYLFMKNNQLKDRMDYCPHYANLRGRIETQCKGKNNI